ncbi:MAG: DNA double-strand break repair nuclease NurA [Methanobrevibacter arboriphilus]|uniref:DNA double-strand break repair nuclease NurA n=1 Tax=Methanobrevibacter arboriphilus TaxID=39441 RepID=A0A843AM31_METAZ|nr:DNA double-strand break repair nuclease NurA [Methanobrevibacter arboriphilus]MBF4468588.1 DNA double-strand break repair nuclease NurA [Methanobrevibacter arboriphilus]
MLESLYTEAIKKKGTIHDKIKEYDNPNFKVSNFWNDEEIPLCDDDLIIAAGDGSKNEKKLLSFYFYAISAESLIYNKRLFKIESSDINTMSHGKFAKDRIRNYMGLFEVKNALKAIKTFDVDYYLYDGSLLGDLIRPSPIENEIPQSIRYDILDLAEDKLNKEIKSIENHDVKIYSNELVHDLKDDLESIQKNNINKKNTIKNNININKKNDIKKNSINKMNNINENNSINQNNSIANNISVNNISITEKDSINNKDTIDESFTLENVENYLENIEKLLALANLLKYKDKIIAISKTSIANDYFKSNIPDMAIFDKYIDNQVTGYSYPPKYSPDKDNQLKREFPVENEFFKSLIFTIFYVRLEKNKNILKIELPYKANEERIKEIIGIISKDCTDGYPYLLKKAHYDVVIKKNDIEQLSNIIGIYEKSGREML